MKHEAPPHDPQLAGQPPHPYPLPLGGGEGDQLGNGGVQGHNARAAGWGSSFPQTITRRDFLKTSAVAASAAAVGTLDLSRSAHAAGSDIIKVGMIGCGGRNAGAASQALTADAGARLVAMCDIFRERIEDKLGALKAAKGGQVTVDEAHCFTGFDAYKHVDRGVGRGADRQRGQVPSLPRDGGDSGGQARVCGKAAWR